MSSNDHVFPDLTTFYLFQRYASLKKVVKPTQLETSTKTLTTPQQTFLTTKEIATIDRDRALDLYNCRRK